MAAFFICADARVRTTRREKAYAPFSHLAMKLFLAAPESGLPSALTALGAQASAAHFFMYEVLAAPASGLPSLPTALLSQVSCAIADPAAKVAIIAARNTVLIIGFLQNPDFCYPPKRRELTASSTPDQGRSPDRI